MRMRFVQRALLVIGIGAMVGLGAAGCGDKEAPWAPWVDELVTPTPDASMLVSGTAEFESTVRITGGLADVETRADRYTARWKAYVSLAEGLNTLSVTATDEAGNVSEPTVVEVSYLPAGRPAVITITGPDQAPAGEPVAFVVEAKDDYGTPVPDLAYTLTTDATGAGNTFAAPNLWTFCTLGAIEVTAEAPSTGMTASTQITIVPGRANAMILDTVPSPVVIAAGETVGYTATPLDVCGNATADWVDVHTNAPGAVVSGGSITGLTRAGTYTLVAQVPSTNAVASKTLQVDPDEGTISVAISVSSHNGFVGQPVGYVVTAVDAYGNAVDLPVTVEVPTDPGATVDPTTRSITFSQGGTHTVTATVGNASDSTFVVVTHPDLSPPEATILFPAPNGVYAPGDTVTVTVDLTDDLGLAQVSLTASSPANRYLLQNIALDAITQQAPTAHQAVFTFDLPGGWYVNTVYLVAQAVDVAGNQSSSFAVPIHVDPAHNLGLLPGFSADTVALEDLLERPRGMAFDAQGVLYVANNGNNASIVRIDPATGQQSVFTPAVGATAEDLVYHATADVFFVSMRGNGTDRLMKVTNAGVATNFPTVINSGPRGLIVDGGTSITTIADDGWVYRYDPAAGTLPTAAIFRMDGSNTIQGNAWGLVRFGNRYAATDQNQGELWAFDPPAASAQPVINPQRMDQTMNQPRDIVLSPAGGKLYVADEGNGEIVMVDIASCAGTCQTSVVASGFDAPYGLVFDAAGNLYVSDVNQNFIVRISGPF